MTENEELQEDSGRQKILVADDEASIRRILETRLKMVGYDVVVTEDGEEAVEVFNKENPDLVVLDVMMPKMDGYGVTREIRRVSDVPIIILTALGDVSERITGLELGADDYVVKPFDPKELLARVKAVTRRYSPEVKNNDVIKFNDLTIDIGAYEVVYKNNIVKLAPKELELLHYMASSPNKVFTREQLMYEVWGYDYPGDSRTVDVHIKRLREKLKGGETWEVQTVWGVGYKFEVK